jgi:hypothetical protein
MMLLQTIAVAGLVAVVAGQTASTEFPETSPMWTRVFGQRNLARCECAELSVSVPCMTVCRRSRCLCVQVDSSRSRVTVRMARPSVLTPPARLLLLLPTQLKGPRANPWRVNPTDEDNDMFSILDQLEQFRQQVCPPRIVLHLSCH